MRKSKTNRWSDYKPAETSSVADLDFIHPPTTLTFEVEGGRTQRIGFSFMNDRPQIASLFAKVLLIEEVRYIPRTRASTVSSLRFFAQFIKCWRPDINHTSLMSYELLQEFAVWMTSIQKYPESRASKHLSKLRRLLKAARSLYPSAFRPDFDIPDRFFTNIKHQKQSSRALAEEDLQRLLAAAEKEVSEIINNYHEGDVPEGLTTLIPFMILIAARTAINPESLYKIRRDCLKPHIIDRNAFHVVWTKGRSKTGIQQQLHYVDLRGKGVIELLKFLIHYTQPLVNQAQEYDRELLFLYRYSNLTMQGVAVAKRPEKNNKVLRAFCRRNGLPEISMVQLRPSAATHLYIKTGGRLRKVQLLLGHAYMSTTQKYVGDTLVQSLHNNSMRAAQEELVVRVTTVIPKGAKQALVELTGELSPEQLEQIAGGEYDTGICKCRNPFDSPQPGQQKGKCCTLFLACLTCPNALFFLEDLPRVIALRDHFLAEKKNMRRGVWEVLYEDKIKIIDSDIIGAFSDAQVAEAKLLSMNLTDISVLTARGLMR